MNLGGYTDDFNAYSMLISHERTDYEHICSLVFMLSGGCQKMDNPDKI